MLLIALPGCEATLGGGGTTPDASEPDPTPDAAPVACEGGGDPQTFFVDGDGDGYGDPNQPQSSCQLETGLAANDVDCNDGDRDINPAAHDLCGDEIDNDCSGTDVCKPALTAHWAFDETQGNVANDTSGRDHQGTLESGVSFLVGQSAVRFDGEDGTTDYITVEHANDLSPDAGSVALWFRVDAILATDQGLWSKDASGTLDGGHLSFRVTSEGGVLMRLQDTESDFVVDSAGTVTAGQWHHVVGTFGPGGLRLYLDGELAGSDPYTGGMGTSSGGPGNDEPIAFGCLTVTSGENSVTPTSAPMTGDLADVQIYSRELTRTELGELLGQTTPAP